MPGLPAQGRCAGRARLGPPGAACRRADPARGRAGGAWHWLPGAQLRLRYYDTGGPRVSADPGRLRRDGAQRHPPACEGGHRRRAREGAQGGPAAPDDARTPALRPAPDGRQEPQRLLDLPRVGWLAREHALPVAREECCLAGAEVCPEARPADGGDELHEGCLRSIVWSSLARKRSSIRGRAVLWIACAPPFGSCQGMESCPRAWINLPEKPSTTGSNWRICILVASQTACPIRGLRILHGRLHQCPRGCRQPAPRSTDRPSIELGSIRGGIAGLAERDLQRACFDIRPTSG